MTDAAPDRALPPPPALDELAPAVTPVAEAPRAIEPEAVVEGEAEAVEGTVVEAAAAPDVPEGPAAAAEVQATQEMSASEPPASEQLAPHPARRAGQRPPRAPRAEGGPRTRIPRAPRPGNVPAPEHRHLPGWVRREYARSRPPLADLLGLLEGERRTQLQTQVDELTTAINAGRFSLAWQYPAVVDAGRALYEAQAKERAVEASARRGVEDARRRVAGQLQDAGDGLAPDVLARLQRTLRTATDTDAIAAVAAEISGAVSTARSSLGRRREREIERTRARIRRASGGASEAPSETWQDVLRRLSEQG